MTKAASDFRQWRLQPADLVNQPAYALELLFTCLAEETQGLPLPVGGDVFSVEKV